MKKMTALLAALCTLPCLTGCGSDSAETQNTTASAAAQTTTGTTVSAALTTAATAALTESGTTAADTETTANPTTANSATGKTTVGTTVTTKPGDQPITVTLEGHIAVLVDDIIMEYGEKSCEEGYVVCRRFQSDPQVLRLPLDTCQKLEKGKVFTFVIPQTEITDRLCEFYFYPHKDRVFADYAKILERCAKAADIREAQNGEYGLDCDETVCIGMTADKMPQNEDPEKPQKTGFTGEVIQTYPAPSFEGAPYDYVLLLHEGEPEILPAKKDISKLLTPGKEYRFAFNKDGFLTK